MFHKNLFFALILFITLNSEVKEIENIIQVVIEEQKLYLIKNNKTIKIYDISTSKYGIGSELDSFKTPLGKHEIAEKCGEKAKTGETFKYGVETGTIAEIYNEETEEQQDLITTRVLKLNGLEDQNINSYERGIWIHGTPYEGNIGKPSSHGCIRMKNKDIVELFDLINKKDIVMINLKSSIKKAKIKEPQP